MVTYIEAVPQFSVGWAVGNKQQQQPTMLAGRRQVALHSPCNAANREENTYLTWHQLHHRKRTC